VAGGALKRACRNTPQTKEPKEKDPKEDRDGKGAGAFHGLYYEVLGAMRKADGTRSLLKEILTLNDTQYESNESMVALKETLEKTATLEKMSPHIEKVLDTWKTWTAQSRAGAMCILHKQLDRYCDEYVKAVNAECAKADNIEPDDVGEYGKTLDAMHEELGRLMATGVPNVFGKAMVAQESIVAVKPKLVLATDRTSVATILGSFTGSAIVSDSSDQSLKKLKATVENLDTDLLREQEQEAIRILTESWSAFSGKLGVSVHMDSAYAIMDKLTVCLKSEETPGGSDSKAQWQDSLGVLNLAYDVSKKFTKYLAMSEPRAPQDPDAALLKELQVAHNEVQQQMKQVMPSLSTSDINDFLQRLRNTISADGQNHVLLHKNAIEAEFDTPYNGEGSLPLIKILGGRTDGKGWLADLKDRDAPDARTLVQKARESGLLHRSDKAFTDHTNKVFAMFAEMVILARDFGVVLDGAWKVKWQNHVKTGQITQLERKIIDVIIKHHTTPREMGLNAKTEHAKFAKQIQDGMHGAMKKLYKQAAGSKTIGNLGELSIDGQDPDPLPPQEGAGEGEDGSGGAEVVAQSAEGEGIGVTHEV